MDPQAKSVNICVWCGDNFIAENKKKRYCCNEHKQEAYFDRNKWGKGSRYKKDISLFFAESQSYSERTKEIYSYLLQDFDNWLSSQGLDMGGATALEVIRWLKDTKWGNSLQCLSACAIRSFASFRFGPFHPLTSVKIKRHSPGPQRTLNESQVIKLIESIDTTTILGIRNIALVSLLLDTGLRASEICNLKLDTVDLEKRTLKATVKGGEIQHKVFSLFTSDLIKEWLEVRRGVVKPGIRNVFVSVTNRLKGRGNPLTRDGLRTIFRYMGEKAGMGLISPHDMRRSMATIAIRNGTPTRLVQLQGGWKDLQQLVRYTQALSHKDFELFAPMRKISYRLKTN